MQIVHFNLNKAPAMPDKCHHSMFTKSTGWFGRNTGEPKARVANRSDITRYYISQDCVEGYAIHFAVNMCQRQSCMIKEHEISGHDRRQTDVTDHIYPSSSWKIPSNLWPEIHFVFTRSSSDDIEFNGIHVFSIITAIKKLASLIPPFS